MERAQSSVWGLVLIAGFYLGCESTRPVAKPADSRTQSTHFLLSRHPNPSLFFSEQEMAIESFGKSADGREQIKIFTTDAYVAALVQSGNFDVDETIWPGPVSVQSHARETSEVGGRHTKITCPPTILTKATSDYLWSYPEIAQFANDLARSPSGMVSAAGLGPTQNGKYQIVAAKFGPLPGSGGIAFVGVPTIYLIATQHAREWGAAGTAVGLMRELAATIDDPTHRPSLRKLLESTAVVIVPVANPEGYEYSRTTARTWRGNRNTFSCATFGVDLNRNHEATWGVPAESVDLGPACSREVFAGSGPSSESETRAIRALLGGGGFEWQSAPAPVVLLDYHTYSDIVVYPSGLKAKTDNLGPACEFLNNNCQTADFQALRELLGDTTSHRQSPPMFVDNLASTPGTMFRRDQAPNIIYTSSGTLIDDAMYSTKRRQMLSATVELFDQFTGHNIECQARHEDILKDIVLGQMDVVERLAGAAKGLLASAPNNAWLPMRLGTIAPAVLSREYHSGNSLPSAGAQHEDVRPTLLIPGWTQATGVSPLTVSVNGQPVVFDRLRRGVQYELFAANWAASGVDPLCPPCEISTRVGEASSSTVAPNCWKCVDLCDPSRVQGSSGWNLNKGIRGGAADCWWSPSTLPATLTIGPFSAPVGATHCTFSFSYRRTKYLGALVRNAFTVQRETPSGVLELLWSEQPSHPYSTLAPQKLGTQIYEASELLPMGRIPAFVLSANDPSAIQGGVEVLDPVVYCRLGRLP